MSDDPEPVPGSPGSEKHGSACDEEIYRRVRRLSRRGFLVAGAAAITGAAGYQWLRTRPAEDGIPWPLRRMHELNEALATTLSSPQRLAPEYARRQSRMPRVNGVIGLSDDIEDGAWRLNLIGAADPLVPIRLSMDDIKSMPRVDMVTRLCCIEGWSEIVHWSGARLADLVLRYPVLLGKNGSNGVAEARYLSVETPDQEYFVGLDLKSALHPQTLLCYEMNGAALEPEHGAPLRLAIPHKYGIKNLKCVGTLAFVHERPDDYWGMRGYDFYSGL
ncbi:MAG: molybdopterin-dependent oxidoreductase [Candidatus Sumerlaeaceae bacterium]